MRVATWNLDHASNGNRPIELQISRIMELAPDILVLTETCEQVALTRHGYEFVASHKNGYGKYDAMIWTKPPIKIIPKIHSTSDAESAVCAQLSTPLGELMVYGTIIPYHGYKGKAGTSAAWQEHYNAIERQGSDWTRIGQEARLPLIVAGDFNQTRDGSSRTYGTKYGRLLLSEQLDKSGLACITTENFADNGKLKKDPAKDRARNNVDHICVTANVFEVAAVGAWDHFTDEGVYLSDHNGVYVDLIRTSSHA
ncbi:MAG: endonuclease/exonuclease/phosphatase family protein [Gallionella sp.]|nr:endonuclease/exonuclease/phosphatase family protein [Gallionella sp.]MDD4947382.1 endonuclease/exonuclease/phosphatase family protein [Gallionella sp.]